MLFRSSWLPEFQREGKIQHTAQVFTVRFPGRMLPERSLISSHIRFSEFQGRILCCEPGACLRCLLLQILETGTVSSERALKGDERFFWRVFSVIPAASGTRGQPHLEDPGKAMANPCWLRKMSDVLPVPFPGYRDVPAAKTAFLHWRASA